MYEVWCVWEGKGGNLGVWVLKEEKILSKKADRYEWDLKLKYVLRNSDRILVNGNVGCASKTKNNFFFNPHTTRHLTRHRHFTLPPPKWLNFIKRYFTHKTIERLSASLEIKSDYFWDRFNVSEVLIQTKITQFFFFYFWNEY